MTKTIKGGNQNKKGLWTKEEDKMLMDYVEVHGKGQWNLLAKKTGLKRSGKSCRLRWLNYLSPNVKQGNFTEEEEDLIIRLHNLLGNRWSLIAKRVPGRTDNQVKNYWNTHLSKKMGLKKQGSHFGDSGLSHSRAVKVPEPSRNSSPCGNTSRAFEDGVNKGTRKFGEASESEGLMISESYLNTLWEPGSNLESYTLDEVLGWAFL